MRCGKYAKAVQQQPLSDLLLLMKPCPSCLLAAAALLQRHATLYCSFVWCDVNISDAHEVQEVGPKSCITWLTPSGSGRCGHQA